MATVNKNILNSISGRVGNLVFRKFNGKTVVSLRPESYKKSNTAKAKMSRERFASVVKFARFISKIPSLADSWQRTELKGISPYMKILNANLHLTEEAFLSLNNLITPAGFRNPFVKVEVQNKHLKLSTQILKNEIKRFSSPFTIHIVFYFILPTDKRKIETDLSHLHFQNITIADRLEFPLFTNQLNAINEAAKTIVFAALFPEPQKKSQRINSTTIAFEIKK